MIHRATNLTRKPHAARVHRPQKRAHQTTQGRSRHRIRRPTLRRHLRIVLHQIPPATTRTRHPHQTRRTRTRHPSTDMRRIRPGRKLRLQKRHRRSLNIRKRNRLHSHPLAASNARNRVLLRALRRRAANDTATTSERARPRPPEIEDSTSTPEPAARATRRARRSSSAEVSFDVRTARNAPWLYLMRTAMSALHPSKPNHDTRHEPERPMVEVAHPALNLELVTVDNEPIQGARRETGRSIQVQIPRDLITPSLRLRRTSRRPRIHPTINRGRPRLHRVPVRILNPGRENPVPNSPRHRVRPLLLRRRREHHVTHGRITHTAGTRTRNDCAISRSAGASIVCPP